MFKCNECGCSFKKKSLLTKHKASSKTILYIYIVEEVPVKWMDRPSATEMERGRASEMDRQTKCHKNENATEMDKI